MIACRARRVKAAALWQNGPMADETLAAALRRVPMLAALPPPLRERRAALCGVRSVERGELLFAEGEPAAFLPLLLSGQVKLVRVAADGREQLLHLVRAPASFAEAAVFGPGVFPVSAEVVRPGMLATLPRAALLDLLRQRPEVGLALLASMSVWMRRLANLVEGLSLHTVEERVAAYLLSVFRRSGQPLSNGLAVRLEDAKHLIAAVCGTAPEVLSRTFRRLEVEGAVRIEGPVAHLLDPGRLVARAGGGASVED